MTAIETVQSVDDAPPAKIYDVAFHGLRTAVS